MNIRTKEKLQLKVSHNVKDGSCNIIILDKIGWLMEVNLSKASLVKLINSLTKSGRRMK